MKLATVLTMARSGRLGTLRALTSVMTEFTRACFLTTAARDGVLTLLARGPAPLTRIATALGIGAADPAGLRAWLDVGVMLGELGRRGDAWVLRGKLARALAQPRNDDALAALEELTGLHYRLVMESPTLLRAAQRLTLQDQSGEIIARSSRLLEPLVEEAILATVPSRGPLRILEVGCGSGTYVRFVLEHNPDVHVHALELQPQVAAQARANLAAWGIADRVTVETRDLRTLVPGEPFDLVTLHNNIYYFPDETRVALLAHVRSLLAPAGRILLTTACPGGSASVGVLHLWGLMTEGCGPLPEPQQLVAQLNSAGFVDATAQNVAAPLDRFFAFTARNPER